MISDYKEEMDTLYIGIKKKGRDIVTYVHTSYNIAKSINNKRRSIVAGCEA